MKVKECMCNNVHSVLPNTTVCDCARIMGEKHIGCVPVCNSNNELLGFITDRDLILRAVANNKNINNTCVCDLMTSDVCCCNADNDIKHVQNLMAEHQVRRIPVLEDGKVVGILTLGDLAKHENIDNNGVAATFENICKCNDKNAE